MRWKILDTVPKVNEEYSPTENKSLDRQQEDVHGHKVMQKRNTWGFGKNHKEIVANYK